MRTLLCLLLVLSATTAPAQGPRILDDFESGLRAAWESKVFKGLTDYRVVTEEGNKVLQADSRGSASALILPLDYDLHEFPLLTWRWKVANIIAKGDETRKAGDDYAARIYVIFPHWFFPLTKTINYIWANRLPKGESIPNPFTGNAMMLAVESGPLLVDQWQLERRNVLEDYRRLFGGEPPRVGAIAIMTDTDNTGESARAWYDDLRLERE